MGQSVRNANATAGLAELTARWLSETSGLGKLIFAGAGTGSAADFREVYSRPVAQGGGGLNNPDVRFGSPSASREANSRAAAGAVAFNAAHPDEPPAVLDGDSQGKAGWIESIESEQRTDGLSQVVAGFFDDRAHNRLAAQAAGFLRDRMMVIKAVGPGISFSQLDNRAPWQVSSFVPNP
jgi:hypothetical protein